MLNKVLPFGRVASRWFALTCNRLLDQPAKCLSAGFHSSTPRMDLMEFFDDKTNWGANEVKVGRSWQKEELRIKSNSDLHKLWFVLLKEKNMLITMEHECNEEVRLFPNPERIDKVKESMENLEGVIRERNKAYFELETGASGERPGRLVNNQLGMRSYYRMFEHLVPRFMNKTWQENHKFGYGGYAVHKFLRLYREQRFVEKKRERGRRRDHVMHLLKRFPNMDMEALKQEYPDVDIEKAKLYKRARGHHEFNS